MVWAATMGLPLSLEGVGSVLKLDKQKLTEGKDLIKYFCQPCAPTKSNDQRTRNYPYHAPDKWSAFKKYNARDVETEMSIQEKLFVIGSRLAAGERELPATGKLLLGDEAIAELEKAIDAFTALLPPLRHFILPGGDPEACRCHVARTVCRRAERRIVALASGKPADPSVVKYFNRLSDFLCLSSR